MDLILGLVVLKLGEPRNHLGSSLTMQSYKNVGSRMEI